LNYPLTHDEALADARELVKRNQHAVVVTLAAAREMIKNSAGVTVASMPDMKF
jgi:fructose-1-phosphate kinase PfkB-like protein